MLEINQEGTLIHQISQNAIFKKRQIISVSVIENESVEIDYIDTSDDGEKYQVAKASFNDYQEKLEHCISDLIDKTNNKE